MAEPIEAVAVASDAGVGRGAHGRLMKNAMLLVGAQVLATPLSIAVNAVIARRLGPQDFGQIYVAQTFCTFGFLFVEWGQQGTLPAMVAKDRSKVGEFLGSGLAWRLLLSPPVYLVLALTCAVLGYGKEMQVTLALSFLGALLWTVSAACQDTVRGFERTDIAALAVVGQQFLNGLFVVPTLLLGGRLRALLCASAFVAGALAVFAWVGLRSVTKVPLSVGFATLRRLVGEGWAFLVLALTLRLQPSIDAMMLWKLAPPEAAGWFAAATKLSGVLVFPAIALISSFYPTFCRLHAEDQHAFVKSVRSALNAVTVAVAPAALGCALYPDLGIRVYNRVSFGPAEDDLRVMSMLILLVYFSMMLGASLAASGRQRAWAIAQSMCLVVSLVLDPLLIPWFQSHRSNGGLGVCVSGVVSEVLMLAAGVWLAPRGLIDRTLVRTFGLTVVSGLAMAGVARLLHGITPFVAAPLALMAYAACCWATGAIDPQVAEVFRNTVLRKFSRSASR
jgi:O-antigen/teichoic acid export membrane protein